MTPNYSIIIPHKNIPDLLQRCLDSIPKRDDIQVIIVDDASEQTIVDFEHFPGLDRNDTEVYFTKEGRGAGFARNVGLEHAKGKWLLFLDADDFLSEESDSILKEYIDAEEDLILFKHRSVLSEDISIPVLRSEYLNVLVDDFLGRRIDENTIRCSFIVVSNKLIRKELLAIHDIHFNETRWSNDNYFSAQVACHARKMIASDKVLFVMTQREGSLTSDFCGTMKEAEVRLQEAIKSEHLFFEYGMIGSKNGLSSYLIKIICDKHGFLWCLLSCFTFVFNRPVFRAMARFLYRKTIYHFSK